MQKHGKMKRKKMKKPGKENRKGANYIFITGGMSGLGKGLVTASTAKILQSLGFNVTVIKIDPYLNVDAGTMSPFEHGEVFVTSDGYESDQDLGVYERFLNKNLTRDHNITTGRIFWQVLQKERAGKYLGKTVQPIPHITNEIKGEIKKVVDEENADFVVVEIGGTVGDIENALFLEAIRQLAFTEKVKFIHVVYIPELILKEQKTKMAQHSVKRLREVGIEPDFLIARTAKPLTEEARKKLSLFCNVKLSNVISSHDISDIYRLPLLFLEQDYDILLLREFGLPEQKANLSSWKRAIERKENAKKTINIGIVGKYSKLRDSYISIEQAFKHCEYALGLHINLEWIDAEKIENGFLLNNLSLNGILVPGGFGERGAEGKIKAIRYARENGIPFLGLCLGFQLAAIEFARNVCGLKDATSAEFTKKSKNFVIDVMGDQEVLLREKKYGATMRLGAYPCRVKKGTLAFKAYGKEQISERHRHRYEINNEYRDILESKGMVFSGINPERDLVEIAELKDHPFFMGTQFHPELKSRPLRPHPLFCEFIKAAIRKR